MGALTPIGLTIDEYWEAMMRGESGAAPITRFDPSAFKTHFACELKGFDPLAYMDAKLSARLDPFARYALAAARQAIEDAGLHPEGWSEEEGDRCGIVFGSGIGGINLLQEQTAALLERGPGRVSPFLVPMMIGNMAAGVIAMEFGMRGPNHSVVSACATGNQSIGDALLLLRHGYADVIVCGGSEAPISPVAMAGYGAMRALSTRNDSPKTASRPFDVDRDGFVAGEGAGALVLETLDHALARNATIHAEILGFGASSDAYHYTAPDPDGRGMRLAMERALDDGHVSVDEIDHINMHATSTKLGDVAETEAIKRTFGDHAYRMKLTATKSMIGHLQGAAGAVEAVATILAIEHGRIPPTINVEHQDPACDLDYTIGTPRDHDIRLALSTGFGFGGHNTAVLFGRYDG